MNSLVIIGLNEKHLASLGSVVVEFSNLEWILDIIIGSILRLSHQQVEILLDRAMIQAKLNLIEQLGSLKLRSKKSKAELADIISELRDLNSSRVVAVHGLYMVTLNEHVRAYLHNAYPEISAYKKQKGREPTKLGANKLKSIAEQTAIKREELFAFAAKHWFLRRK